MTRGTMSFVGEADMTHSPSSSFHFLHGQLQFCQDFFLSQTTLMQMSEIKQQLLVLLSEMAFVPRGIRGRDLARNARRFGSDAIAETVGPEYNTNSDRPDVIKAVLTAAFAGNYAFAKVEEPTREEGGPPRKSVSYEGETRGPEREAHPSVLTSLEHLFLLQEPTIHTCTDGSVAIHPSSVMSKARPCQNSMRPELVFSVRASTVLTV